MITELDSKSFIGGKVAMPLLFYPLVILIIFQDSDEHFTDDASLSMAR